MSLVGMHSSQLYTENLKAGWGALSQDIYTLMCSEAMLINSSIIYKGTTIYYNQSHSCTYFTCLWWLSHSCTYLTCLIQWDSGHPGSEPSYTTAHICHWKGVVTPHVLCYRLVVVSGMRSQPSAVGNVLATGEVRVWKHTGKRKRGKELE